MCSPPRGGGLPEPRLGDQRRRCVGSEIGIEQEDDFLRREENLVPVEPFQLLGIERWAAFEERANGGMLFRLDRQDDRHPPRRIVAELKRGELFDDFAHQARLRDRGDRDRSARAPLDNHRGTPVDALAGQTTDSDAREEVVGNLLRPLESVEANPKGQQLELAGGKRRSPFTPDHAIARSHVLIVGGNRSRRIG